MKNLLVSAFLLLFNSALPAMENEISRQKEEFREIWAYVLPGEEKNLSGSEPITDLCYFSGELSYKGELKIKSKIPSDINLSKKARRHLVVADIRNMDLVHFLIHPDLPLRKKFIQDLSKEAADYDGIQIDFESVSPDDRDLFFSFLKDIKQAIGKKTLSIAVPARVKEKTDSFTYKSVCTVVDRVFIMAYDEHWSGSHPGPVASAEWCGKVAAYASSVIPSERLVIGIPFYGRSWQDKKHDKALRFSSTLDIAKEKEDDIKRIEGPDPGFEYEDSVKVTVFYENTKSIMNKASIYKSAGVRGIGFWRVGQEPKEIWSLMSPEEGEPAE